MEREGKRGGRCGREGKWGGRRGREGKWGGREAGRRVSREGGR